MKLTMAAIAALSLATAVAQTPTPAQGRDYGNNLYRVVRVDDMGRIVLAPSSSLDLCTDTTPCVVAGVDGGGDVRVLTTDTAGNLTNVPDGQVADGATFAGKPVIVGLTSSGSTAHPITGSNAINDGYNGASLLAGAHWYYNGASFDRARGDTDGAYVKQTNPANLQSLVWGYGTNGSPQVYAACDGRVALSLPAASTTLLIPGVAGKNIFACGFFGTAAAAGTVKFISGTGPTCGTGTQDITGAMTTVVGVPLPFGNGLGVVFSTLAAGDSLCAVTTGAASTFSGVLTFEVF